MRISDWSSDVCSSDLVSNARYVPFFQRTGSRPQCRNPNQIFVCAITSRMVGLGGLEPPASPLSGVRSNHLSYRPNVSLPDGGASRDRTDDPLLAKQVLSQLSYGPKRGRSPGDSPVELLDAGHLCGRLTSTCLCLVVHL